MKKPALVLKRLQALFFDRTTFSGMQSTPFRVLVGTVLSARTRDRTTAKVAASLFKKYPTAEKLAEASLRSLERVLRPIGFYRAKSRHVKKLAEQLVARHGGQVPDTMDELVELAGVGRKTASCVLNYAFRKPAIAVDIHVFRITNRLGLVKTKTPEQTEIKLKELYPRSKWRDVNNAFVLFGQNLCLPRNPKCGLCVLNELCPSRTRPAEIPLKARFLESRAVVGKSWRNAENQTV